MKNNNMNNVNKLHELMTVIGNIQGMKAVIDENYDVIKDFKGLEVLSEYDLRKLQSDLIPLYNKAIKIRKATK